MNTENTRQFKGHQLPIEKTIDSYVVLDLETTGLSPVNNSIIEVAAIKISSGRITDQYQTLVRPPENSYGQLVPKRITMITGISSEMVEDAPVFSEIADELSEFIGDLPVVGHNVNFDINFLYENFMRCRNRPFTNDFVDTLSVSRRLLPQISHSLADLSLYFNIVNRQAHRALSDVMTTHECYLKLKSMAEDDEHDFGSMMKNHSWIRYKHQC